MPKLKIFYILSLIILGVLVFTLFRPMATGEKYSEVLRESLLKTEAGWIIQFDITNREGKDQNYDIKVVVDGKVQHQQGFMIRAGWTYIYMHHLRSDMLNSGDVSFIIYKEGEDIPFEQITYHLK